MCKPFPPPLVRGGVFEVGLETKYRDIADGNRPGNRLTQVRCGLETKYRDIADGNKLAHFSWAPASRGVGNQVPRYSGFKTGLLIESDRFIELLSSVVFIANA